MVMSIREQITSLEEELANTKGPGSVAKKKELQEQIDKLKEEDEDTSAEKEEAQEAAPVVANQPLPPYRKVTMEQVKKAEAERKLCGFDPANMTASIRD